MRSLEDKRYRVRIGLPAVHIGRRIGFDERDIERLIAFGREEIFAEKGLKVQDHEDVELAATGA